MSTVCYCGNDCGAPSNNTGACLASARKQRDELLAALKAAELLLSYGDFRNGVTHPDDPGGVDEGDIRAGQMVGRIRAAIAKAEGKS